MVRGQVDGEMEGMRCIWRRVAQGGGGFLEGPEVDHGHRPVSSTTWRNSGGEMSPCWGCCQRRRASKPTSSLSGMRKTGW
jgi:hypothetical protein